MSVEAVARAKINLVLRVGALRSDGFHQIATLMQSVSLRDSVRMSPSSVTSVEIRWDDGLHGPIPQPPDLTHRAMDLLAVTASALVVKRIPLGAGLAGGSADAAAALLCANRLSTAKLSEEELVRVAAELGSDVPFALRGGAALATGRGERLQPVTAPTPHWWVLAISDDVLSTPDVYRRHDKLGVAPSGDPVRAAEALESGDVDHLAAYLSNDLESAAFDLLPSLADRKRMVISAGAVGAVVSGSGPTIAALCRSEHHAVDLAQEIEGAFARTAVVRTETRGAEVLEGAEGG